jgi:UDP-glucose 4-epimerase
MLQKKILVTGGSGFIGTHLAQRLLETGHEVIAFDLVESKIVHPFFRTLQGDIRNAETLDNVLNESVDAVFHFAAIVSVMECENAPYSSFETNFLGTQVVLNRLLELKPKKTIPIFFASSAAVYGDLCGPNHQLNECEHLPAPLSFYALHKYASEQSIRLYCRTHGLAGLCFRFFNVFGPGQKMDSPYSGVIAIFQKALESNSEVILYNHGNNTRDFIHVSDVARACSFALNLELDQLDGSCVNICTGKATRIEDILISMANDMKRTPRAQRQAPRQGDIEHSCGDPSKASHLLGFTSHL